MLKFITLQIENQAFSGVNKIFLLVITPDFLNSRFILDHEVPRLLKKRAEQGARIFPLIVKPCDWESVEWMKRMNLRPRDGKPLSTGAESEIDIALTAFVKEIRKLLTSAPSTSTGSPRTPLPPDKILTSKLPVTGKDLLGREKETAILDDAWNDGQTAIISLVAFGGVGKSALINHLLNRMRGDNFRGAARVYGWSFSARGPPRMSFSTIRCDGSAIPIPPGVRPGTRASAWPV